MRSFDAFCPEYFIIFNIPTRTDLVDSLKTRACFGGQLGQKCAAENLNVRSWVAKKNQLLTKIDFMNWVYSTAKTQLRWDREILLLREMDSFKYSLKQVRLSSVPHINNDKNYEANNVFV